MWEIVAIVAIIAVGYFFVVEPLISQTETYTDPCGAKVELTPEVWKHIQQEHPEIKDKDLIRQVVEGATSIMTDGASSIVYIKEIGGNIYVVIANKVGSVSSRKWRELAMANRRWIYKI